MPSCAFSIHAPSVSASFKQGITMIRSIASVIPKIYLEKDSLASVPAPLSLNFRLCPVLRHNPQFRGPNGNDAARIGNPCLLCRMFLGRTVENQFTEISRLVSLFPSGAEPRPPSRDFGRGNAQRASANDPPIAQRIAALRVARVVDNQ